MVVKRQCSFCADEIEPGTGTMFVKRDGTVFHFCSSSCRKQQLHLGRVGHRRKWTRAHAMKRVVSHAAAHPAPGGGTPKSAPAGPAAPAEPSPPSSAPTAPEAAKASPTSEGAAAAPSKTEATAPAAAKPASKPRRRTPKAPKAEGGESAPPATPPTA